MNEPVVLSVFALVYLGMILGRLPGLSLDRTGVALLGAIAMVVSGQLDLDAAWSAVDVPTLALLFGLMVVSAQFRLGGFYTRSTRWLGSWSIPAPGLLAAFMAGAALLSTVLANDVVCLAATSVLIETCDRRGLDPVPFLIGLACSANIGSAATLIGNPQNILIGEALDIGFASYSVVAAPVALLSLFVAWAILAYSTRGRWRRESRRVAAEGVPFDLWQTAKAAVVIVALVLLFLADVGRREVLAIGAAGLLLLSRRTASKAALGLVDWQLLLLFIGLFVVHAGLERTGAAARGVEALRGAGVDLGDPGWLFASTAVASNVVSNVPAVMLLLPVASDSSAGATMALASTLAGNLLLVGSIANLIVVDQAERMGVRISWVEHARVGVPVTLATLALSAGWLWIVVW